LVWCSAVHVESPSVRTPVCTPHTTSVYCCRAATVLLPKLCIESTLRAQHTYSRAAPVTSPSGVVLDRPATPAIPTSQGTYAWLLAHPPFLALLSPAPCAVCPFFESGHQPPEITPEMRLSLCIRPLHLSFSPPQPFTVRVGETLSNLRARVARKLGVAAVQLQLFGGPLPQFGTVQSAGLRPSHLLYYEVRSACGMPVLYERDASNHRSPCLPEPNSRVLTHVAGD
jgi:hypothetical protein